jgi:hypothetical protein
MWPFTTKKSQEKKSRENTRIGSIIQLMQHRPTEWEFTKKSSDFGSWNQVASHKKSGVSIRLNFGYQKALVPDSVQFWHTGSLSKITGREKSLLIDALHQLQFDRINQLATKHLKLDNLIKCYDCGEKIIGWAWICKCQSALDQICYGKDNVCPACSGSLVGGFIDDVKVKNEIS